MRSRALFDAGQTSCFMGRYDEARPVLEEGLAIAREIWNVRSVADILQPLGLAFLGLGDRPGARAAFEEALDLARKRAGRRDVAAALNGLAQFHRIEGALDLAEPLYEQVVAIVREIGDRESTALALLNVAMVYIGRGLGESARKALVEVDAIAADIGSKPASQSLLEVCAGLASFEGDWARAARLFGVAESQNALTGMHRYPTAEASSRRASPRRARASGRRHSPRRSTKDDCFPMPTRSLRCGAGSPALPECCYDPLRMVGSLTAQGVPFFCR